MDGGNGGGGGPAPFLLKTYEMVDDATTDEIVSWSSGKKSFVVWNPPEFARVLLPSYFKHNNFSSFIRQLNTYGFRKIDPEKWEFANEDFVKDQKHLLKNIHRRKPIHSHSHPPGSLADAEKAALDEEIEKLLKEKSALETNVWRVRQQQSGTKTQLDDLESRVQGMEQRQFKLMSFLARAVNNSSFVENLIGMTADTSIDFMALKKKRRLPKGDCIHEDEDTSFVDNNSCTAKSDLGNICPQDFCNKLKLALSPAVCDSNMLASSAQSCNEDGVSPVKQSSCGDQNDGNARAQGLLFVPETVEVSDTCTSFALGNDGSFSQPLRSTNLDSMDDCDGHITCHLSLSLASSALQTDGGHGSGKEPQMCQEFFSCGESQANANGKESDLRVLSNNKNPANDNAVKPMQEEAPITNQGHPPAQGRVNDVFWEQFLTERPGSSDTEVASSSLRGNSSDDQEERPGRLWSSRQGMKQLSI
ncbi:hypothetical protein Scep_010684 [Stephania cephalantha]|uniref:HSF-type DNA-binding domain-containing protein n=1 Tax=Stephania cephalantha TaxID=152367 RepID=A0AAP0JWU3_9MAGN